MNDEQPAPFPSRFGFTTGKLITSDFPHSARVGLYHILKALVVKDYVTGWSAIRDEIERIARMDPSFQPDDARQVKVVLMDLAWPDVYIFCERVYASLLRNFQDTRAYYQSELNQLLAEESIAYEFKDGQFSRPGRYHTQKMVAKAARVLALPELSEAQTHFSKALQYFGVGPEADHQNAVKEAVAALEATIKSLFPEFTSNDIQDVLKRFEGTKDNQIPPTIVKGILSIYEFRGAATGVAHGGATGGMVSPIISELVLSVVASYITFFVGFRAAGQDEPPF